MLTRRSYSPPKMLSLTVMKQSWTPGSIMPMQYCLVGYIWTSSDCSLRLFSSQLQESLVLLSTKFHWTKKGFLSSLWLMRPRRLLRNWPSCLMTIYFHWGVCHQNYMSTRAEFFVCYFSEFACGSDENTHEIPWEKVIENPHQYFDTSLYKLPYALNAPDVLKSKPHHIFALHDFFLSISPPFQFRSNHEVPYIGWGRWARCRSGSRSCLQARNILRTLDQ